MLNDPFGRSRMPAQVIAQGKDTFSREHRIALIGRAAQDLLAGTEPDREAAVFLAGAILGWLENGGDLQKDFFKVVRPKSHLTPSAVWKRIHSSSR